MEITVNGAGREIRETITIQQLLEELGRETEGLAVAVNDEVVPRDQWQHRRLDNRDRVEIIQAVQGG